MSKFFTPKGISILMSILITAGTLTGCSQLRDKFVRKSKDEPTMQRYYSVREYDVRPNLDLYTKRYIFWKSWNRELLNVLSDSNQKKKIVAAEQSVSNLMDMQAMLVDEKYEGLKVQTDEMIDIETIVKKEGVTPANEVRLRKRIERVGKAVRSNYSYNDMREYLRSDFRTE